MVWEGEFEGAATRLESLIYYKNRSCLRKIDER
jgi:hypothetical protein